MNYAEPVYDRWLSWFGSHHPSWLETLIRCTGIHNYVTHRTFNPMEKLFLANGLRFICTPPRIQLDSIKKQLLSDSKVGWQRFSRTLGQKLIQSNSVDQQQDDDQMKNKRFKLINNSMNAAYAQATQKESWTGS